MPNLPLLQQPPIGPLNVMGGSIGAGSFNGFVWGSGTNCFIVDVQGFDDLPSIRQFDAPRGYDHGEWQGVDFSGGRDVTLKFQIRADPSISGDAAINADMTARLALLQNATVPQNYLLYTATELPLFVYDSTRYINCRVRKRSAAYYATYLQSVIEVSVLFHSVNERIYSATQKAFQSILANASNVGRTYPRTYNYNYGGPVGAPPLNVLNNGNWPARPIIVITGPALNPLISNITTKQFVQFLFQMGAGDTLLVDMDLQTAWLNGAVSRRSTLSISSNWWEIPPGTSQIQFSATQWGAGANMVITYNDCWI